MLLKISHRDRASAEERASKQLLCAEDSQEPDPSLWNVSDDETIVTMQFYP